MLPLLAAPRARANMRVASACGKRLQSNSLCGSVSDAASPTPAFYRVAGRHGGHRVGVENVWNDRDGRRRAIFSDILDFRERVLVSGAQASATRGEVDRGTGSAPVYAGERLFVAVTFQTDAPTNAPQVTVIGCQRSCGCLPGWARPARCRSVRLRAGPTSGGRAHRQVGWNRIPRAEVHLVGRLAAKRRMGQHPVVFLDVELHQSPDGGNTIQRVEEQPLVFERTPPRLDQ